MHLYLYADDESIEVLGAQRPKALLIGSDFGYGNFGDVLQHKGAISRVKAASGLAAVSILTLDAISRYVDTGALRKDYGADALAFVSEMPIASETAAQLQLREVAVLRNVSYIQLYGGGFLNEMWGDFVLGVAEYFLERLPGAAYVISGQQIAGAYASRVRDHVARFKPQMLGVRDRNSAGLMADQGMRADFSFDDAVEPLLELHHKLGLQAGEGAFVHLNTSGYTGNDGAMDEMVAHLRLVADRVGSEKPTLLHAFQDAREEVVDSIETVKRLESGFPFTDVETVMLVAAIMESGHPGNMRVLTGRFGYSSSYHVTLWLQLAGIPCWLRGSNEYYRQKRAALGIEGRFEDFLEQMHCPDHRENLHERSQWVARLEHILGRAELMENRIAWERSNRATPERTFNFKGEPRMEERLNQAWQAAEGNRQENERLRALLEGDTDGTGAQDPVRQSRHEGGLDVLFARFEKAVMASAKLEIELLHSAEKIGELEQGLARERALAEALKSRLEETELRMQACNRQLTEVGTDARYYREQYLSMQSGLQQAAVCAEQLRQITSSRSWRITRPLRVANRFLATRRFDPAGEVGVYAMLRIVAEKLPIKARWRSAAGRTLRRFRRR
ncbi:hypothetical protein ASG87_13195 [Frateuria sp. Soil773]|uniref:hypothetical protein n=1 Tax=Frateuria sp. Soil773 TaxID=1736407 RepID=UPI0006F99734|nr:hypothetical protein [Frateuria sp. Soil773]KRE99943.1 hypothetical protein ASG87_13195 [Frateuria sp. Soil773]